MRWPIMSSRIMPGSSAPSSSPSFGKRLRGKEILSLGLESRSTSGGAFSEDGVKREEAKTSTGVASEFQKLAGRSVHLREM
jgi:hypothetical protein